GADTINVTGEALNAALTINAGGGNDTVTAGNAANHLSNLNGPVTVNGNAGTDSLTVNALSNYGYRVTNSFVADLFGANPAHTVNYGTMEGVTLNSAGTAVNSQIQSTASGTPVFIDPGAADTVSVGGFGFPLTGILSAVIVNASAGNGNYLTVDDTSAANGGI